MSKHELPMSEDVSKLTRRSLIAAGLGFLGLKAAEKIAGAQNGGTPVPTPRPGEKRTYLKLVGKSFSPNSEIPPTATPTPTPVEGTPTPITPYANLKEMADTSILTYSKEKLWEGKMRKLETRRSSRWNISSTIKPEYEQQVIDEISKDLANQGADRIVMVMLENIDESPPEIVAPPAWPNDWKEYTYNRNGVDTSFGFFAIKKNTTETETMVVVGYAKPSGGFLNESGFINKVIGRLGIYLAMGAVIGRDVSANNDQELVRLRATYPLYQQALQVTGV